MKKVLIINEYATLPTNGYGGRSYYLAKYLSKLGINASLVFASHHHMTSNASKQNKSINVFKHKDMNIYSVKTKSFASTKSFQRVLNWFVFMLRLLSLPFSLNDKPDVIIYSSPSLPGFLSAYLLKLYFNSTLILDVRDIWPLTLIKVGGIYKYHPLILVMRLIECISYKLADKVISTLPNTNLHIKVKSDKFKWIPNGVDIEECNSSTQVNPSYLKNIDKKMFSVGYIGALGYVNSIDTLLEAALHLKEKPIQFYIIGEGKLQSEFESFARKHELVNVHFLKKVPKSQVQGLLSNFDCLYLGWRDSDLYKFGAAPNKLPEYFYAKKPVIHSYSGAVDLVNIANAGISVPAENVPLLSNAILDIANMSFTEREAMALGGFNYTVNKLNYEEIAKELLLFIDEPL